MAEMVDVLRETVERDARTGRTRAPRQPPREPLRRGHP